MKKIALLLGLLLASPAFAADNTLLVTPCSSGCITPRSKDVGAGVQSSVHILGDTSGNPLNLPTAGADGASNTATGLSVYAMPAWFNGTTWDRARGDATNGAFVNVKTSVLPTSAATSTKQSDGTQKSQIVDGSGNVIASTSNALNFFCSNCNANGVATAANSSPVVSPVLTNAGAAVVKGGTAVVNGGSFYQAVAASQTATVLQSSTGAIGDYLSHCVLYPTSTSPGVVTVFDNTNAAAGSAILFPGGATSLSNLAPISIPVGAVSTAGAWKVTTGASISVVCYGKFS